MSVLFEAGADDPHDPGKGYTAGLTANQTDD
jgi:hypothetical protein